MTQPNPSADQSLEVMPEADIRNISEIPEVIELLDQIKAKTDGKDSLDSLTPEELDKLTAKEYMLLDLFSRYNTLNLSLMNADQIDTLTPQEYDFLKSLETDNAELTQTEISPTDSTDTKSFVDMSAEEFAALTEVQFEAQLQQEIITNPALQGMSKTEIQAVLESDQEGSEKSENVKSMMKIAFNKMIDILEATYVTGRETIYGSGNVLGAAWHLGTAGIEATTGAAKLLLVGFWVPFQVMLSGAHKIQETIDPDDPERSFSFWKDLEQEISMSVTTKPLHHTLGDIFQALTSLEWFTPTREERNQAFIDNNRLTHAFRLEQSWNHIKSFGESVKKIAGNVGNIGTALKQVFFK